MQNTGVLRDQAQHPDKIGILKFSAPGAEYLIQNILPDLGALYKATDTLQTQRYRERNASYFKDEALAFINLMKPWDMNGLEFPTILYESHCCLHSTYFKLVN